MPDRNTPITHSPPASGGNGTAIAPALGLTWTFASRTAKGHRPSNQDAVVVRPSPEADAAILAIADGMGGHAGGERASRIAQGQIEALAAALTETSTADTLRDLLPSGYAEAQKRITEEAASQSEIAGMGTTLSCIGLVGDQFVVSNIGDTRVYLLRGNSIEQITIDHNRATDAVRRGKPLSLNSPEEIRLARALTRVLRAHASPDPDLFPEEGGAYFAQPGDVILIACDGLYGSVDEQTIAGVVQHSISLEAALEHLEALAIQNGSQDNITTVAAAFGPWPNSAAYEGAASHWPGRKLLIPSAIISVLLVAAAILAAIWPHLSRSHRTATPKPKHAERINARPLGPHAALTVPLHITGRHRRRPIIPAPPGDDTPAAHPAEPTQNTTAGAVVQEQAAAPPAYATPRERHLRPAYWRQPRALQTAALRTPKPPISQPSLPQPSNPRTETTE